LLHHIKGRGRLKEFRALKRIVVSMEGKVAEGEKIASIYGGVS
jgi:hypothetical protein